MWVTSVKLLLALIFNIGWRSTEKFALLKGFDSPKYIILMFIGWNRFVSGSRKKEVDGQGYVRCIGSWSAGRCKTQLMNRCALIYFSYDALVTTSGFPCEGGR